MRITNAAFLLALALAACGRQNGNVASQQCAAAELLAALPAELTEASGIALSRRTPGILWVHNDSGEPVLVALDSTGEQVGRVRIAGVHNTDWEDIAAGPCGSSTCLYIGAIGDNLQNRSDRAVLRLREPAPHDTVAFEVEQFPLRFPERQHDAEALFVLPDERIYLLTKGRSGPVTLYVLPQPLRHDLNVLQPVQTLTPSLVQLPEMITAAAATPNGEFVIIRSYSAFQLYRFRAGKLQPALATSGINLQPLGEFQGEGIDIQADGTIYLVSEKGLQSTRPPLSRIRCNLPPP